MKYGFFFALILCSAVHAETKLSCSQLTDDFCKKLWLENRGNLPVADGQILAGATPQSEMNYAQKGNFEAWLRAEKRLPADLRKRITPALRELRTALKHEKDTKEWYSEVAIPAYRLDLAIDETAQARVEKKWPELKKVRVMDRTFDQERKYWQETTRLKDEVTTAQYEDHPNWLRVQKMFKEAQKDVLSEISELKVSADLKKLMRDQVQSVRLVLPLLDPHQTAASENCPKTEINSYYFPLTNTFTVCAGMFNTYRADSAIYLSIAHEISHSIDPIRIAAFQLLQGSPVYQALQKMKGAKQPVFTCEEWDHLKQKLLVLRKKIQEPRPPELGHLYTCLNPRDGEKPFNTESLRQASGEETVVEMDAFVNSNTFTRLAQPTYEREHKVLPNEFYMDPTKMRAVTSRGFDLISPDPFVWMPDVFAQSYACQKIKMGDHEVDAKTADIEHRQLLFEQALHDTQAVDQVLMEEWFIYCGRNCGELTRYGLSKDVRENFADWMAGNAFEHFLLRETDLQKRREMSAIAVANLCTPPGPVASAPFFTAIEKRLSLEAHPDNPVRRYSLYRAKIASAVQCEMDDQIRGSTTACEE